jgi:hypothetical protein
LESFCSQQDRSHSNDDRAGVCVPAFYRMLQTFFYANSLC